MEMQDWNFECDALQIRFAERSSSQRIVRKSTLNACIGFCTATAASNRDFGVE